MPLVLAYWEDGCMVDAGNRRIPPHLKWTAIWLLYLIFPLIQAWNTRTSLLDFLALLAIIIVYVAVYLTFWKGSDRPLTHRLVFVGTTLGLATGLTVWQHSILLLQLAVYAIPALAVIDDDRQRWVPLGALFAIDASILWLLHADGYDYLNVLLPFVPIAAAVSGIKQYISLKERLNLAEEEIEALAIANERLRIARDLHDGIGHTLSAIVLRSDLAQTQAKQHAPAAAQEMARVASLAREALDDLRGLVGHYRAIRWKEEWARLHQMLSQAGIATDIEVDYLPSGEVERVLLWILREAITNIIRHSQATMCRVRLIGHSDHWLLTIDDNGQGNNQIIPGNGLQGLQERAAELGGQVRWSSGFKEGFHLFVQIPRSTDYAEVQA